MLVGAVVVNVAGGQIEGSPTLLPDGGSVGCTNDGAHRNSPVVLSEVPHLRVIRS
jgi:hypothetical protein